MVEEELTPEQLENEIDQAFAMCHEILTGTNIAIVMSVSSRLLQYCVMLMAGNDELIDAALDIVKNEVENAVCIAKSGVAPPTTTTH